MALSQRVTRSPGANELKSTLAQEIPVFDGSAPPLAGNGWTPVLLVDSCERGRKNEMSKADLLQGLQDGGVVCEHRGLPVGDYLWIARKEGHEDRVLDCVIERKTFPDLENSLIAHKSLNDSKWHHPFCRMFVQKMRLRNSGIANKIILVEGKKSGPRCFYASKNKRACTNVSNRARLASGFVKELRAGWHEGIQLVRTKSVGDTVRFLIEKHQQIMKDMPVSHFSTLEQVHASVKFALESPTFRYRILLRRIRGISEAVATSIMELYPGQPELLRAIRSTAAEKAIANLKPRVKRIGKVVASRIAEEFPVECKKVADANPTLYKSMEWMAVVAVSPGETPVLATRAVAAKDRKPRARRITPVASKACSPKPRAGQALKRLAFDEPQRLSKKARTSIEEPYKKEIPADAVVIELD